MSIVTSPLLALALALPLMAAVPAGREPAVQPGNDGVTLTFQLMLNGDVPAFVGACPPEAAFCGEFFKVVVLEVAGPRQIGPSDLGLCLSAAGPPPGAGAPPCKGGNLHRGLAARCGLSRRPNYPLSLLT